jgi:isoquinoline 1-oxidoreductase alpha subunit
MARIARISILDSSLSATARHGEAFMTEFTINGRAVTVAAGPDTPLLWAIRDHLGLTGTKYGCGIAQCGACTVHVDGAPARSCQMLLQDVAGRTVTTIEGLSPDRSHPLQRAWIAEQVPQCGYCQSGQIMQAAALLKENPRPTREQIVAHMDGNLCRCGTYVRIISAIQRAAQEA